MYLYIFQLNYYHENKRIEMKEQDTPEGFSHEAWELMQKEVPKLTDSEYRDLRLMMDAQQMEEEITLDKVLTLLHAVTHMGEEAQIIYSKDQP